MKKTKYNPEYLKAANPLFFAMAKKARSLESLRERLSGLAHQSEFDIFYNYADLEEGSIIRVRDSANALRSVLRRRSDHLAGFSVAKAILDISHNRSRPDLSPAFYADLLHMLLGVQGRGPGKALVDVHLTTSSLKGRDAAVERSRQLDLLWSEVNRKLGSYAHGLEEDVIRRRATRRDKILRVFGASIGDWNDWRWQIRNIVRDPEKLEQLVSLPAEALRAVEKAKERRLPFGITPYYISLMDDDEHGRDRAIRAQVLPPMGYVEKISEMRGRDSSCLDFMREEDTSPVNLVTRRYPAILILKPFNSCPQICVYCQRNWEIEDAMAEGAFAGIDEIDSAIRWIEAHPAIHEVLITGGDPLAMGDNALEKTLQGVADIPSVERIRIGTRTIVTMPMRITDNIAKILKSVRKPGRLEIVVVTHVQHVYELTHDVLEAVERLRGCGIPVYNQLVYTFYVSRRFEAAALRRRLRLIGIDPYYTFNTKGKDETMAYRVPIARLLQEQNEEARLLPGLSRTDEAVFNVPGLGKNYLRAKQNRDLLSILPDGSRVYEFHPWEKNISETNQTYVAQDVPIQEYLERLEENGESAKDYSTIWYYY
jgi:lysine 2,3-aminomutase